jgi:septal ring factor EnvC (AmiA/AmiB activator)
VTATRATVASLAALLLIGSAGPVAAAETHSEQDARQGLSHIERDLATARQRKEALDRQASEQAQELEQLRRRLVAAGQQTRAHEATLSGFEDRLEVLQKEAADKRAELGGKQERLAVLLTALQRLALAPSEALLVLPQSPIETVRGAIIMGGTVPAITAEATALRTELASLAEADAAVRRQRGLVEEAAGKLLAERRALDTLVARKTALEQHTEAERRSEADRLTRLAGQAQNLRDLIVRLEQQRRAEELRRAAEERRARARAEPLIAHSAAALGQVAPSNRGGRTVPAAGKLMASYGQSDDFGATTRGLTIETRPGGVVVAPDNGRILFSGPFRGYGLILIIEHAGGYHSLLAGLGRIDAAVGRAVQAGEPVGTMGQEPDRNPSLYFELRRSGQPTNPQPWLIAQGGK